MKVFTSREIGITNNNINTNNTPQYKTELYPFILALRPEYTTTTTDIQKFVKKKKKEKLHATSSSPLLTPLRKKQTSS